MRILPLIVIALVGGQVIQAEEGIANTKEYKGIYKPGFETSTFHPCSSSQIWWLRVTNVEAAEAIYSGAKVPKFVRVEGAVTTDEELIERSSNGRTRGFGHLNQYPREIRVSRALEVRPATQEDLENCRWS